MRTDGSLSFRNVCTLLRSVSGEWLPIKWYSLQKPRNVLPPIPLKTVPVTNYLDTVFNINTGLRKYGKIVP